jgi:hypothetical protein
LVFIISDLKIQSINTALFGCLLRQNNGKLIVFHFNMFKILPLALLATLVTADPIVYLIRHGEKPDSGNGLSTQGLERAQCLRTVFGATSVYNIGHIMAQTPESGASNPDPLLLI